MNMDLILTGPDPEQVKAGAGVGILVNRPAKVRQLAMSTEAGKQALALGRLIKGAVQGPKCSAYNLLVVYGWADSDRDRAKKAREQTT